MRRTSILLPPELHREVEREASALGISMSELIRRRLSGTFPLVGIEEGMEGKPRFFSRKPWAGPGCQDAAVNHDRYLYGP